MTDTPFLNEEKYDFKTDAKVLFTTGKGLNEDVVRKISVVARFGQIMPAPLHMPPTR